MALTLGGQSSGTDFGVPTFDTTVIPSTIAAGDIICLAQIVFGDAEVTGADPLEFTAGAETFEATEVVPPEASWGTYSVNQGPFVGYVVSVVLWYIIVSAAVAAEHNDGNLITPGSPTFTGPSNPDFSFSALWHFDTDDDDYVFNACAVPLSGAAADSGWWHFDWDPGVTSSALTVTGESEDAAEILFMGIAGGNQSGSIAPITGTWTGDDTEEASLTRNISGGGVWVAARLATAVNGGAGEQGTWTINISSGANVLNYQGLFAFEVVSTEVVPEEEVGNIVLTRRFRKVNFGELPYELHTRMLRGQR